MSVLVSSSRIGLELGLCYMTFAIIICNNSFLSRDQLSWNQLAAIHIHKVSLSGGIQDTVYTCWVSMKWSNWWTGMNTVLFIVLPFCLCLSLRPHSHCGECERGDGRGGKVGEGEEFAWCPMLQATEDQATVIHWEGEVSRTGRLLGQHWPWCLLGETCQGAL